MKTNLEINNRGIFPVNVNRSAELRARTFLYFANTMNRLSHRIATIDEMKMVHIFDANPQRGLNLVLTEMEWVVNSNAGEGYIYLADVNSGWTSQVGRLLLIADDIQTPMEAYFSTPQRWLEDRNFEKIHLEKALKGLEV